MSKAALIAFFSKYLAHKLNTTAFKSAIFQNFYSKRSSVGIFYSWNWTINRDIISLIGCRHHTLFKYPDFARGYNDNSEIA